MSIKLLMTLLLILNIDLVGTPVAYREINGLIDDEPLRVHTVIADMNNPHVAIRNVLSKDVIFGLEKVTEMSKRMDAYVAVNGVFYDNYGHHIGGMMIDGEWLTIPSNELPTVLIDKNNQVSIEQIEYTLKIKGQGLDKVIDGVNRYSYNNSEVILYNGHYGSTTRLYKPVVNYLIKDNVIQDIIESIEPINIPDGYDVLVDISGQKSLGISRGDKISFSHEGLDDSKLVQVFQTSSWLIRDGEIVAQTKDPVIGLTVNREPRTAIGVTKDNRLIIAVVDGRLPGVSVGLSGSELAILMSKLGCMDAVYLDGGASSTLIVDQEIVNTPSNKKERLVGHGLVILYRE